MLEERPDIVKGINDVVNLLCLFFFKLSIRGTFLPHQRQLKPPVRCFPENVFPLEWKFDELRGHLRGKVTEGGILSKNKSSMKECPEKVDLWLPPNTWF